MILNQSPLVLCYIQNTTTGDKNDFLWTYVLQNSIQRKRPFIESYLERIELFFTANGIAEEKKVAVFLSVIGSKTYTILRSLVALARLSEKGLDFLNAEVKSISHQVRLLLPNVSISIVGHKDQKRLFGRGLSLT